MRLLLDNPTGGHYYLNGVDVSGFSEAKRTNLRKGVIGFVFQSFNLIEEHNVFENIELPLLYMGVSSSERKKKVEAAMERMQIAHRVKHFPQQLSNLHHCKHFCIHSTASTTINQTT